MNYKKIFVLLLIGACSYKKGSLEYQPLKGHKELYSEPALPKAAENKEGPRRLVIAATNDVQGNYRSRSITFKDDHSDGPQNISIGGVSAIAAYFKVLRDQYKPSSTPSRPWIRCSQSLRKIP